MKRILSMVFMVIGSAFLAALLLSISFLIPVSEKNVKESEELFALEEWYPHALNMSSEDFFDSTLPAVLDNVSDYTMFCTAVDDSEESGLLKKAMRMHSSSNGDYSYYWHGYVLVLRPLFWAFNYIELRYLNMICQVLFVLYVITLVYRESDKKGCILFGAFYIFLMPVSLMLSFQYSWVFYITLLVISLLLSQKKYLCEKERYLYIFLLSGILTSFFDLLTYPLITWGVPMLFWLLIQKEGGVWFHIKTVVASGLSWILGYAGMWISKWVFADIILGREVFQAAVDEARFRSGIAEQATKYMMYEALYNNIEHYFYSPLLVVIAAGCVVLVMRFLKNGCHRDDRYPAFFLVSLASFVWYLAFSEHTRLHHFFTYRIYVIWLLGAFIMLYLTTVPDQTHIKGRVWLRTGVVLILVVSALFLQKFSQSNEWSFNGSGSLDRLTLGREETIAFQFIPQYRKLVQLDIDFETYSQNGELEVRLEDMAGNLIRRKKLPLALYQGAAFHRIEIDAKLDTDQEYIVKLCIHDTDETVDFNLLIPEEDSEIEITSGTVRNDIIEMEGHPLIRFKYVTEGFPEKGILIAQMLVVALGMGTLFPLLQFIGIYKINPHILKQDKNR